MYICTRRQQQMCFVQTMLKVDHTPVGEEINPTRNPQISSTWALFSLLLGLVLRARGLPRVGCRPARRFWCLSGVSRSCRLRGRGQCRWEVCQFLRLWLVKGEKKTHRYDETNDTADQLPLVNTGKPAVKIMTTHMTSAAGVEYSVCDQYANHQFDYSGRRKLTSPSRMPRERRKWQALFLHRQHKS